jgi:threonine/homoserine/homoserine lactone efflux protein
MRLVAICAIAFAFAFVGSMPLTGPIAVLTLSRAAEKRFGEALRIGLGAALAEALYAALAFWGFATFLSQYRLVVPISRGATGVVLTGLGVRFMFWRLAETTGKPKSGAGTTLLGFTISALNPTLLVTWSTAVALLYSKGLGLTHQTPLWAIPFGACAGLGVSGWFICYVKLLRRYGGRVPRKVLERLIRAMGVALLGLGIWSSVQLAQWLEDEREGIPHAAPARVNATSP